MLRASGSIRRREGMIAVAVDSHNKGSQYALKWAIEQIDSGGQIVNLIHVKQRTPVFPPFGNNEFPIRREPDDQTMDLFLPFRCFCLRRKVECEVVVLEDPHIANALVEYVYHYGIDTLVLGAPSRNGFSRLFKHTDIPSSVTRMAPDFCNVYVISKAKVASARPASRLAHCNRTEDRTQFESPNLTNNGNISPYLGGTASNITRQDEFSTPELDVSFASSERRSTDSSFLSFYQNLGNLDLTYQSSKYLNEEKGKLILSNLRSMSFDVDSLHEFSSDMHDNGGIIIQLQQNLEDMENKVTMLDLKLKETVEMYNAACNEALTEKQKTMELQQLIIEGERGLEEERSAKEAALKSVQAEKAKCKEAMEAAETAQNIAGIEVEKRVVAEMNARKEAEEKKKVMDSFLLFLFYSYINDQLKLPSLKKGAL